MIFLAYVEKFLYLCARNCKMGNCVDTVVEIVVTLSRQLKVTKLSD